MGCGGSERVKEQSGTAWVHKAQEGEREGDISYNLSGKWLDPLTSVESSPYT